MLFAFALKIQKNSLSYTSLTFGGIYSWFNYSCDSEVEMPSELILTFEALAR